MARGQNGATWSARQSKRRQPLQRDSPSFRRPTVREHPSRLGVTLRYTAQYDVGRLGEFRKERLADRTYAVHLRVCMAPGEPFSTTIGSLYMKLIRPEACLRVQALTSAARSNSMLRSSVRALDFLYLQKIGLPELTIPLSKRRQEDSWFERATS